MTRLQRGFLGLGLLVIGATLFFPPWRIVYIERVQQRSLISPSETVPIRKEAEYRPFTHSILNPPSMPTGGRPHIQREKLFLCLGAEAIGIAGIYFLMGAKKGWA